MPKIRLYLMINHLTFTPMTNLILDMSYCGLSHIASHYYLVKRTGHHLCSIYPLIYSYQIEQNQSTKGVYFKWYDW